MNQKYVLWNVVSATQLSSLWLILSFFHVHVRNCLLLPVRNLMAPSCSSTPISYHCIRTLAICKHLRQKLAYLCLHEFSGPKLFPTVFWCFQALQNSGFGGKIRQAVVQCWPPQTSSYLQGLLPHCQFWRKLINKCDCESVDRQTDRQTDRQMHTVTETNWNYNLSDAICSSYGQIITLTTCHYYYYKTRLEPVSLSCKSHRSKTANVKILSINSMHRC